MIGRILALILFVLLASNVKAAALSFVGTWVEAERWCRLYKSGKLDEMDYAHSSWSGLFTIDDKGNMDWRYVAQSCTAKKLVANGNSFRIDALCEYHGEDMKSVIAGTVRTKNLRIRFSNKKFPLYGINAYTKCD
jgi:hypothetical protein